MAFKFKVKKRPTAMQSAMGGFAQGFGAGITQAAQLSLQDRLKQRERDKETKKEFNTFRQNFSSAVNMMPENMLSKEDKDKLRGIISQSYLLPMTQIEFITMATKVSPTGMNAVLGNIGIAKPETGPTQTFVDPTTGRTFLTTKEKAIEDKLVIKEAPIEDTVEIWSEDKQAMVTVLRSQGIGKPKGPPSDRPTATDVHGILRYTDGQKEQVFVGDQKERKIITDPQGVPRFLDDKQEVFPGVKKQEELLEIYDPKRRATVRVERSAGIGKPTSAPSDRKTAQDRNGVLRYLDTGNEVFVGVVADREKVQDENRQWRYLDTKELVFPDVVKIQEPRKDYHGRLRRSDGSFVHEEEADIYNWKYESAPDGHLRFVEGPSKGQKVFPDVELPDKWVVRTLNNGDQVRINPATGDMQVIAPSDQRTPDENANLSNLLKERKRLLAKKNNEGEFSLFFGGPDPMTFESGGGTWNAEVDQPKLKAIEDELSNKYDYHWLVSEYEILDVDRPLKVPEEVWKTMDQPQKREAVDVYRQSLLPSKPTPVPVSQQETETVPGPTTSDQPAPASSEIGFKPQAPSVGAIFRLPPELVKKWAGAGMITVREIKGDKIMVTTNDGTKKIIPIKQWYTFRFAPVDEVSSNNQDNKIAINE